MKKSKRNINTRHDSLVNNNATTSGITLISLVITIIVLLVLAGVVIAMLTGDNGILTKTQLQITNATGGRQCLELLAKEKFALVFLDHMMPDMDGIETFHAIRKRKLCDGVPVVMLTANAIVGDKEMYLEEGFDDFLSAANGDIWRYNMKTGQNEMFYQVDAYTLMISDYGIDFTAGYPRTIEYNGAEATVYETA